MTIERGRALIDHSIDLRNYPEGEGPPLIDVHFFKVRFLPYADKDAFLDYLRDMVKPGHGVHNDVTAARLREGPSYIELGGWLGDQHLALYLMALGQHHGVWKVITPATIGLTGLPAADLAGRGFVTLDGALYADLDGPDR